MSRLALSFVSVLLLVTLVLLCLTSSPVFAKDTAKLSPSSSPSSAPSPSDMPCRFSPLFGADSLFSSQEAQQAFQQFYAFWEGQFAQPNPCAPAPAPSQPDFSSVGYHAKTGMTLDGHRLAIETGLPLGLPHQFTAASKESLHLAVIAQALSGNEAANIFLSPSDSSQGSVVALNQLLTKVNTYDAFFQTYPGFGGFLPWVMVTDDGLVPTADFNSSVPSLDNGQLFWGAYAVAYVLKTQYHDVLHAPLPNSTDAFYSSPTTTLAERWQNVVDRMVANSLIVFYDAKTNTSTAQFRTVSVITDRTKPIDPNADPAVSSLNYNSPPDCNEPCFLDDPYEGELFTDMVYLFGNWTWTGASPNDVWLVKRPKLQAVNFTASGVTADRSELASTPITVERGWWFSGHEKWKFFLMPYLNSTWSARVFRNGERARTWYSWSSQLASGYASVTGTANNDEEDTGYKSDCGIEEIAFQPVSNKDIVTPYSFAALFLASPQHAYVWLHNYLLTPRGQTCFGSLEGFNRTGSNFSPVVTWDTKVTTFVAMNGGIGNIVAQGLEQTFVDPARVAEVTNANNTATVKKVATALDLFVAVVDREWSRVFEGVIVGEQVEFQLPNVQIPDVLPESSSCTSSVTTCQCSPPTTATTDIATE